MGLNDLPFHRREALLWRYALELDYDGVDDLVCESAGGSCNAQWGDGIAAGECTAVLGDDGRYHLLVDGTPRCVVARNRRDPAGTLRHTQWCYWWTDGTRYRVQAPADAWGGGRELLVGETVSHTMSWLVTMTDMIIDPALVPLKRRCVDQSARIEWPGYQGPDTPDGRQRARLVAALGRGCHACGERLGAFIDHDHFTGMVRGLLCVYCNTHIDSCPHVAGCVWADYLNNPPAGHLQLRYTKPERVGRSALAKEKIEYLGFDPFYRGPAAHRRRLPSRQLPPPVHTRGADLSAVDETPLF